MADKAQANQPENKEQGEESASGDLVRPNDWDAVLHRAETTEAPQPETSAPRQQHQATAIKLLKASTPLLIILFFVGYKLIGQWDGSDVQLRPSVPKEQESLSGVEPEQEKPLALSPQERALVSKIESLRNQAQWATISELLEESQNAPLTSHPVIKAFSLITRARLKEQSIDLERALVDVEKELAPARDQYGPLLHETRIARAQQIIWRSGSWEILQLNIDRLHELLGDEVESPYEGSVRVSLARLYEDIGDRLSEKADGVLKDDPVLAAEARKAYQLGLRWVVDPERWYQLTPTTPAAEPLVGRMVEKLATANQLYHGNSLPFTGRDSRTWSGLAETPIHDSPKKQGGKGS